MTTRSLFRDRDDAGLAVARALGSLDRRHRERVLVLGMPRGGVPVARQVADAFGAPLDVMVARKLGVPGIAEVALGAIAEGWRGVALDSVGWYLGVPRRVVARIAERERRELERRVRLYRAGRPLPGVRGRTVVLVDDGLATGATLRAAALVLRARRPARLIVAVPVAQAASCDELRTVADELVAVVTPDPFETVSASYEDFSPVSDADVLRLLRRDAAGVAEPPSATPGELAAGVERTVAIPVEEEGVTVAGDLELPDEAFHRGSHGRAEVRGLVILAHGGGSSRQSYRNRYLAGRLRLAGWATLRVDLLVEREQAADAESGAIRFDVALLARRLRAATDWAARERIEGAGRIVLFGASTGAAAALVAAAERPALIAGVASRGGRVDLAADALQRVCAPVLMVVGGGDPETLDRNRDAMRVLRGDARLKVIPGAGHTFEEAGALGAAGEQVVRWLEELCRRGRMRRWLRNFGRGEHG